MFSKQTLTLAVSFLKHRWCEKNKKKIVSSFELIAFDEIQQFAASHWQLTNTKFSPRPRFNLNIQYTLFVSFITHILLVTAGGLGVLV